MLISWFMLPYYADLVPSFIAAAPLLLPAAMFVLALRIAGPNP